MNNNTGRMSTNHGQFMDFRMGGTRKVGVKEKTWSSTSSGPHIHLPQPPEVASSLEDEISVPVHSVATSIPKQPHAAPTRQQDSAIPSSSQSQTTHAHQQNSATSSPPTSTSNQQSQTTSHFRERLLHSQRHAQHAESAPAQAALQSARSRHIGRSHGGATQVLHGSTSQGVAGRRMMTDVVRRSARTQPPRPVTAESEAESGAFQPSISVSKTEVDELWSTTLESKVESPRPTHTPDTTSTHIAPITHKSHTPTTATMRRIPAKQVLSATPQTVSLPQSEVKQDVDSIELGLIEELDIRTRHPQPHDARYTDTKTAKMQSADVETPETTATDAETSKAQSANADVTTTAALQSTRRKLTALVRNKISPRTAKSGESNSPFLKSINVEKRPLSTTASAASVIATSGLGEATGLGGASLGSKSISANDRLQASTKLSKVTDSFHKKPLPKFEGPKKNKSRAVGPTVIVSQGNKLRSNIGLAIAVTLTVLVGGVVGAFIYLAFFQ